MEILSEARCHGGRQLVVKHTSAASAATISFFNTSAAPAEQ